MKVVKTEKFKGGKWIETKGYDYRESLPQRIRAVAGDDPPITITCGDSDDWEEVLPNKSINN